MTGVWAVACVLGAGLFAGGGVASAQPPDVSVTQVTGTLDENTIGLARPGDGSGRLFTVVQDGQVQIWDGAQVRAQPFLDLGAQVSTGSEQGLLGVAFHPDYAVNGHVYVYYTDLAGDSVIARYTVSGDPNVADGGSGLEILGFAQPAGNHNAGDMHFGPDGYLYIASGDGGGDWCQSQDEGTLLGKILRIDVDGDDFPGDPDLNYAIPPDNPLVGVAGAAEEIWALGLRNPWRFSFDRSTGDLYIGDVGEAAWEEFDRIPAGTGGVNLGWPWFEGEAAFQTCAEPSGPFATCDSAPFTCPFTTLSRAVDGACSAIGGYRYAGADYPGLAGLYFFADWCGGIVKAAHEQGGTWTIYDVAFPGGFGVTGFGEDDAGELFYVNRNDLYQIVGDGFLLFADGFESGDPSAWSWFAP